MKVSAETPEIFRAKVYREDMGDEGALYATRYGWVRN